MKEEELKLSDKDKILVTYETNWADEVDVMASILTTVEEWEHTKGLAKIAFDNCSTCTHHMGNMEIEYHSYKEWFNCYTVKKLTEIEFEVLTKFNRLLNELRFFIPEY